MFLLCSSLMRARTEGKTVLHHIKVHVMVHLFIYSLIPLLFKFYNEGGQFIIRLLYNSSTHFVNFRHYSLLHFNE